MLSSLRDYLSFHTVTLLLLCEIDSSDIHTILTHVYSPEQSSVTNIHSTLYVSLIHYHNKV